MTPRCSRARCARRSPWLAGGALLVAVLTGLIAVGTQVASVDALLTTNYGESLLAKSALMAAAGLFGLATPCCCCAAATTSPAGASAG